MAAVVDRVRLLVAEALGANPEDVCAETELAEIALLDSLSFVEIASAIDDDLGIRLPGDELTGCRTVADVARLAEHAPPR